MLSAQDIGIVIGAVATLITAIGGMAIWRGRSEAKQLEGPSAIAALMAVIDKNTAAINGQTEQFKDNNRLFVAVLKEAEQIRSGLTEMRIDMRGR